MIRILQAVSVSALISAAILFVLCAANWLQGAPGIEQFEKLTIAEKFRQADSSSRKSSQKTIAPLVRQAEAFALYLNPPQPPKHRQVRASISNAEQKKPVLKLPKTTPKFTLLATSYYRARPDESLALVSEPGGKPRWVEQGTHLGHFVIEKIKSGTIVYREGDRLGQMAVNTKVPIYTELATQTTLASDEPGTAPARPSSPDKPKKTRPRSPMHKLGPPRPKRKIVAFDHRTATG
jgi:hypothetical protein